MTETCWVCLRITPEYVLKTAHDVWEKPVIARDFAKIVSESIEKYYRVNRLFFCGRAAKTIVGGLFYILASFSFLYPINQIARKHCSGEISKTQREISIAMKTTEVSLRNNYKRWLKTFPNLLKDLAESYTIRLPSPRHIHKWKYLKQVDRVQTWACTGCDRTSTRHIKSNTIETRFWKKHYGYHPY